MRMVVMGKWVRCERLEELFHQPGEELVSQRGDVNDISGMIFNRFQRFFSEPFQVKPHEPRNLFVALRGGKHFFGRIEIRLDVAGAERLSANARLRQVPGEIAGKRQNKLFG